MSDTDEDQDKSAEAGRAAHLGWCKERALEYVDRGDLANAMASMMSDLSKHPGTAFKRGSPTEAVLFQVATLYVINHDVQGMRDWVKGFR